MPPHKRIGRNYSIEFKQGFAPHRLGLTRQKRTLSVGEPDALSSQPLFEEAILSLKKFDDEQLMPMDPAGHHHQQKRQQRRRRTHANILPRPVVRIYGVRHEVAYGSCSRFNGGNRLCHRVNLGG